MRPRDERVGVGGRGLVSPAKRGKAPARRKKKGGRWGVRVAVALLIAAAAAMTGAAMYFGFVPRPWERFATASDSALADTTPLAKPDTAAANAPAPAADSALPAAPVAAASTGQVTAADSAIGDVVYHGAGRCVGCHGNVGEGASGLGPSLRDSVWRAADGSRASIERVIAGGAPAAGEFRIAMPSYVGQLSADDLAHLATYVYTLSHAGATIGDTLATRPSGDPVNADAPRLRPTVPAPPTRP
jgi:mono/diheme cytochrome c family protein